MKRIEVEKEITTRGTAMQFDSEEAVKLAENQLKKFKKQGQRVGKICRFNMNINTFQIDVFRDEGYAFYIGSNHTLDGTRIRDKDWLVDIIISTLLYSPEEFEKKFTVIK